MALRALMTNVAAINCRCDAIEGQAAALAGLQAQIDSLSVAINEGPSGGQQQQQASQSSAAWAPYDTHNGVDFAGLRACQVLRIQVWFRSVPPRVQLIRRINAVLEHCRERHALRELPVLAPSPALDNSVLERERHIRETALQIARQKDLQQRDLIDDILRDSRKGNPFFEPARRRPVSPVTLLTLPSLGREADAHVGDPLHDEIVPPRKRPDETYDQLFDRMQEHYCALEAQEIAEQGDEGHVGTFCSRDEAPRDEVSQHWPFCCPAEVSHTDALSACFNLSAPPLPALPANLEEACPAPPLPEEDILGTAQLLAQELPDGEGRVLSPEDVLRRRDSDDGQVSSDSSNPLSGLLQPNGDEVRQVADNLDFCLQAGLLNPPALPDLPPCVFQPTMAPGRDDSARQRAINVITQKKREMRRKLERRGWHPDDIEHELAYAVFSEEEDFPDLF